jgi:hypothetical protein
LPIYFAAKAGDVSTETLSLWREKDPQFARDFETARLEAVERRWRRIEKAAKGSVEHPPDWKADAWSLERVYPQLFGRPDLQLSVNQSVATGPTNVVVVGPERAKILTTRHETIRAKTRELLDAREANTGNAQGSSGPPSLTSELVAAVVPAAPTDGAPAGKLSTGNLPTTGEPLPDKPASWWAQFLYPGRLISKSDATLALRMILSELSIPLPADERLLDFPTPSVVQATFCGTLAKLTGSDLGWRTAIQLYERELQREEHRR